MGKGKQQAAAPANDVSFQIHLRAPGSYYEDEFATKCL